MVLFKLDGDAGTGIALGPSTVYFATTSKIMSVTKSGQSPTTLATDDMAVQAIAFDGKNLFWAQSGNVGGMDTGHVMRLLPGAPKADVIATGQWGTSELVVDATSVYWSFASTGGTSKGGVRSAPKTGGPVTEPVSLPNLGFGVAAYGVAVDATHIYWTTASYPDPKDPSGNTKVPAIARRGPITGGPSEDLGTLGDFNVNGPSALDATHYYLSLNGAIVRVPKTGGPVQTLVPDQVGQGNVVVDETNVYWPNYDTALAGDIETAPKAGGKPTQLASMQEHAWRVAVDDHAIYWVTQFPLTVMRLGK